MCTRRCVTLDSLLLDMANLIASDPFLCPSCLSMYLKPTNNFKCVFPSKYHHPIRCQRAFYVR
jgi:hypothetical protein